MPFVCNLIDNRAHSTVGTNCVNQVCWSWSWGPIAAQTIDATLPLMQGASWPQHLPTYPSPYVQLQNS